MVLEGHIHRCPGSSLVLASSSEIREAPCAEQRARRSACSGAGVAMMMHDERMACGDANSKGSLSDRPGRILIRFIRFDDGPGCPLFFFLFRLFGVWGTLDLGPI